MAVPKPYKKQLLHLISCERYRELQAVVGLGLGGPRQDEKGGPFDDVIILSQP